MTEENIIDIDLKEEEVLDIPAEDISSEEISEPNIDAFNASALMIDRFNEDDTLKIYELAIKLKNDPNYNIIPELPKEIYDMIATEFRKLGPVSRQQINRFVKETIKQFGEEISLDKEISKFDKDLTELLAEGKMEVVNIFANNTRKQFEEDLIEKAEKEDNIDIKNRLLEMSQSYKDSYHFKKQIYLLDDEIFISKLHKYEKDIRFKRMCESFNFTLNKKLMSKSDITSLLKTIPKFLPDITEEEIKDYIIATCIVTKGVSTEDSVGLLYMYNSVAIPTMISESYKKINDEESSNFGNECLGYLSEFFNKLKTKK